MAVLESLHFKGAKIAATTHYAELKAYALETPRVENGCCELNVATLSPTYRLLIGVPGRSNALAICERLGMDMGVVDRRRSLSTTRMSVSRMSLTSSRKTADAWRRSTSAPES